MSEAQPIRRKGIKLGESRRMSPEELAVEKTRIIEENFPQHRTIHLKPKDEMILPIERVEIVVTEEVLLATAHHVAQDTSKESGGFLLGNRYVCPNTARQYIIIDQFMKADYTEGTPVSMTFTLESWSQLKDRLDGKYLGKNLVGWYHSHPGMGIFLSSHDLDIHKNRFADEHQIALVLDPIKHEGGFFGWSDGNINPREKLDFYELLEGDSRETVTAWTNYVAEDPKTGAQAQLKIVNTQNSDGNPLISSATSQRSQNSPSKFGGILTNPFALMGGVAILAILLISSIFAGYLIWKKISTDDEVEKITEKGTKVLNADKIKLDISSGRVSSDGKMSVDLKVKGIGTTDVIDQVRQQENIEVEIDGQPTTIPKSEVIKGILELKVEAILSSEKLQKFNQNEQQTLDIRVDLRYSDGDTAAKQMSAKYNKGKEKNEDRSLGVEMDFNEKTEKTVESKIKPKVTSNEKTNPTRKEDVDKKQQQTQVQPLSRPTAKPSANPQSSSSSRTQGQQESPSLGSTIQQEIPKPVQNVIRTSPTNRPSNRPKPKPKTGVTSVN